MKKLGILIIYFLLLCFHYLLEIYGHRTFKITTVFSKIGDAVLMSSNKGEKFLILGGVDYGLDRYLDKGLPGPCFINYVYVTPETNLITFYRILERCKIGMVFYQEKDFHVRKINLKLDNILKTQSLVGLADKINLDLNGISVTVYGGGEVTFRGDGVTFLALAHQSAGVTEVLGSKESMRAKKTVTENFETRETEYLKPPFNVVNGTINPLSAKYVLCSFKICLRNPQEYEIPGINIIRAEDGESIAIKAV